MRILKHLAITPDGNRRYAKEHGLSFKQAYLKGFDKVKDVIEWSTEPKKITFWALSLDNFVKRSSFELKILFKLMQKHVEKSIENSEFAEKGVRVRFFGKRELLPKSLNERFSRLEEETVGGSKELNIAVAYSGRDELLSAAKALAFDAKAGKVDLNKVDENAFGNYLYFNESPDLIIRTGDAPRLSGLLPWQAAYSEIYFSKKMWPEFEKNDYDDAIEFFHSVESRRGK